MGWPGVADGFMIWLVRVLDAGDHTDDQQSHEDDDQRIQPASPRSSPAALATPDEGGWTSVATPQIEISSPEHLCLQLDAGLRRDG